METTTIKLKKTTKMTLDTIKRPKESYDDVIHSLIDQSVSKDLRHKLILGYKSLGKEHLALLEEWESASPRIKE